MTPIIDCPLAAFRLAMTGQNQEPALAERHAVLCECLLQGRSAFGPTPCSLASSAAGTSASRLSRVYPAAVSARVAGAPILPGRPASRDVMCRIVPGPGHKEPARGRSETLLTISRQIGNQGIVKVPCMLTHPHTTRPDAAPPGNDAGRQAADAPRTGHTVLRSPRQAHQSHARAAQ